MARNGRQTHRKTQRYGATMKKFYATCNEICEGDVVTFNGASLLDEYTITGLYEDSVEYTCNRGYFYSTSHEDLRFVRRAPRAFKVGDKVTIPNGTAVVFAVEDGSVRVVDRYDIVRRYNSSYLTLADEAPPGPTLAALHNKVRSLRLKLQNKQELTAAKFKVLEAARAAEVEAVDALNVALNAYNKHPDAHGVHGKDNDAFLVSIAYGGVGKRYSYRVWREDCPSTGDSLQIVTKTCRYAPATVMSVRKAITGDSVHQFLEFTHGSARQTMLEGK
jgi:hypothetical protein